MHSIREYIDPGGRTLARRLDELRNSLDTLQARLRESVSQAIGSALGGLARDVVLHVLENLTNYLPGPAPLPVWPSRRVQDAMKWNEERGYEGRDGLWFDDRERLDEPEPYQEPRPTRSRAHRAAVALCAGVQAVFALRRIDRRRTLRGLLGMGLVVGCAAYLVPTLTVAGLNLINSANQLGVLSGALP